MSVASESGGIATRPRRRGNAWRKPVARLEGCEPQLRRFLLAQGISRTGDFMALAALPFAVFSSGGGAGAAGLLFTCQSLTLLAFLLFGGAIADRLRRRSVMILADLLRLASQGGVAALLISGVAEIWMLVPLMVAGGAGGALFEPAAAGFVPQLVEKQRLAPANALRNFSLSSAAVLGPLVAGALILAAGPGWAFALDSLSFAASALLLARTSPREAAAEEAGETLLGDVAQGWHEFRSRRWLCAVVAQFSVVNALGWAPFVVLGAAVAEADLGGAGSWGMIITLAGLGEIAGCLAALRLRGRRSLSLATAMVGIWAAPLALLALAAPLPAVAAAVLPAGASLGFFASIWDTAVQSNVPEQQLSRISAFDALGSFGMLPLGYLLAGSAQATVGITASLLGCAAVVLLASVAVSAMPSVHAIGLGEEAGAPAGLRSTRSEDPALLAAVPATQGVSG